MNPWRDMCTESRQFECRSCIAYTLPELLLSVLLLGVVLSLLVGWTRAVRRDLDLEAGRRLLVTLNRALDAYHAATGAWPPEERLPAAQRAVGALLEQPESAKIMSEISGSAWSSADRRRLLDAWRTPLRYLGPRHAPDRVAINDGRPIFLSAGPDREFGYAGRYPTSRQVRATFGPSERWVELIWDRPDQLRRPSGITNRLRIGSTEGAGGTLISRIGYANVFDAAGNLDTQTVTGHPIAGENGTLNHSYDRLHRLTASDYPNTANDESWALDELSNWTSHTNRNGAIQTYTDNNLNQYTAISSQTVAPLHDAKGNLVRNERGYGFSYDFENRLTRVFTDNAPSNGLYDAGEPVHAEYIVDPMGRRVQAMLAGQTSYRYFDRDDVLLCEFLLSSPNSPSAIFVNGETSTDEKILAIDASGNEFYYLLKDLDTVAAIVDPSGAYLEAYGYSGYGLPTTVSFIAPCVRGDLNADGNIDGEDIQLFENVLLGNDTDPNHICAADFDGDTVVDMADVPEFTVCLVYQLCPPGPPAATFENPFLFTGQRLDRFDGGDLLIYDYKARTFDPLHGRFQQRDPEALADGFNLYEYVRTRPAVLTDPTGRFSLGDVNMTQFITKGLQAWTKFDSAQQVFEVAKALKSGVSVQGVLLSMVFDLATDKLGGKLFDKFLDAVDRLKTAFPGRVFRGRKGGLEHRGTVGALGEELQNKGFKTKTDVFFRKSGSAGQSRYADLVGYNKNTGAVEIIQVGDFDHTIDLPIDREQEALLDILGTNASLEDILAGSFPGDFNGIASVTIRFVEKLPIDP